MREIKFDIMQKFGDSYIHKIMTLDEIAKTEKIGNDWDNCIKRQSTGLFDKNGVEIYDGDILRHAIKDGVFVKYDENAFCLYYLDNSFCSLQIFNKEYEIVGNIYKNQELLEN